MPLLNHLDLQGKRYFLTPVCLVPNGRAHLGHIAGPILRMDVLRRHLLRGGADARMISLSDSHESHVLIRAEDEGETPETVANRYHAAIAHDMSALGIEYDDLINPLDEQWRDVYERTNRQFFDEIVEGGQASVVAEQLPFLASESHPQSARSYRPGVGDPIVSGWLQGSCPQCEQPLVGFFCESCGGHFQPSEMVNPATAHFDGNLRFAEHLAYFLRPESHGQRILEALNERGVREDFRRIAEDYISRTDGAIRLTVPSPWGISVDDPAITPGQVIFSYSALLIGCHLVAGERYAQLTGEPNPFSAGSDVETIISFGIDNAVPFTVGAVGCGLAQDTFKPVDRLLTNYFYDLEGSKFSTSRRHVIWGADLIEVGGAHPDLARAYLCAVNPEFERVSFSVDGFVELSRQIVGLLRDVQALIKQAGTGQHSDSDPNIERKLLTAMRLQYERFDPTTFSLQGAWYTVIDWLDQIRRHEVTDQNLAPWLRALGLIAAPFLPTTAAAAWAASGASGEPTIAAFAAAPFTVDPGHDVTLPDVDKGQLDAALPTALRV